MKAGAFTFAPAYATMSSMKNKLQAGAMNLLAIPLVLVTLLLFGVAALAYQYYVQTVDYQSNMDQKVAAEVENVKADINKQKEAEYAEKEKSPYDRYDGPGSFGALRILYPKTWSAYVSESRSSNNKPVEGWFAPKTVPGVSDDANVFALRVLVEQRSYDVILREYSSKVKEGKLAARPYQSPNVPNIVGTRLDGEVVSKKQGSMIVMPMRDKTLRMWTESRDYIADFDNIILPNFSFTP
jgi:hypothetical protein